MKYYIYINEYQYPYGYTYTDHNSACAYSDYEQVNSLKGKGFKDKLKIIISRKPMFLERYKFRKILIRTYE